MQEENVFGQIHFWRGFTLQLLKETPYSLWDKVPVGFSNHLQWHAGHILVTNAEYLFGDGDQDEKLPKVYHSLFATGSSPSDWKEKSPAIQDILNRLEEQPRLIQRRYHGRLEEALPQPLQHEKTVEELLCFLIAHECYHLGVMNGLKRSLGVKNIFGSSNES
jgi:uncharacterized damage-inducible protein DinB